MLHFIITNYFKFNNAGKTVTVTHNTDRLNISLSPHIYILFAGMLYYAAANSAPQVFTDAGFMMKFIRRMGKLASAVLVKHRRILKKPTN